MEVDISSAFTAPDDCANGSCVEVAFTAPAGCASGACVETATHGGRVLVRDGKLGDASPVLNISPDAWTNFLEAIPQLDRDLNR